MKREIASTGLELAGAGLGLAVLWLAVSYWAALGALAIAMIAAGYAMGD